MESDNEDFEYLYEDDDEIKHEKLKNNVLQLNKLQNLKKASRSEPTYSISEFDLVKSGTGPKGLVSISELTKPLKKAKSAVLGQKAENVVKKGTKLPTPLEKPQADRIKRAAAYEKTRLKLDNWEALVTSNRASDNLQFPLEHDLKLDIKKNDLLPDKWRCKTPIDLKIEEIHPQIETKKNHKEDEQKYKLTMEELKEKRRETAKMRAYQSYMEAKARRQNKIKSKKFHRIEKKERIKKALKEFELLQKTNPEEALNKLEEIEKARVEERFSLRHKSTGQWAKNKQIRAKYDKESRQQLAQQLSISRDLLQKMKNASDSEFEDGEESTDPVDIEFGDKNPWINGIKPDKEVADFVGSYRKYWTEKNQAGGDQKDDLKEDIKENKQLNGVENGTDKKVEKTEKTVKKVKGSKNEIDEEVNPDPKIIKRRKIKEPSDGMCLKKKKIVEENQIEEEPIRKIKTVGVEVDDGKKKLKKKIETEQNNNKTKKKIKVKSTTEWEVSSGEIDKIFGKLENIATKKVQQIKKQIEPKKKKEKTMKNKETKEKPSLIMEKQRKKVIIDEEMDERPLNIRNVDDEVDLENMKKMMKSIEDKYCNNNNKTDIDPKNYLKTNVTKLNTATPDFIEYEEDIEENNIQKALITEAFDGDDVVEDFNKIKQNEIDKNNPKDIDLTLPGWGSWGGTGIKRRKRSKFLIKAPPPPPRKDDNRPRIIINENATNKVKGHQVSEVPFPFKSVTDFEASIRAPIGNTFVTEMAFKKYTTPEIQTKLGQIIEPITEDILLDKKI